MRTWMSIAFLSFVWAEIIQIDNGRLVVYVEKATGTFAIGTINGESLTDGFLDYSFHTHFNLSLDGMIYSNLPELDSGGLAIYDSGQVIENFIVTQWRAGNTRVWEKISLYPEGDFDNWAYIELGFYNESSDTHWVGWLAYIDIMAGENDNPAVWTPEHGFLQTERAFFIESAFPSYWLAISDTSAIESFTVKGVFEGTDTTYPSFLAFSDATYLEPVRWMFMTMGRTVHDWAMLCKWNPVIVLPYQFRAVGFKYGISPTDYIAELPGKILIGSPYPNPANSTMSIPVYASQQTEFKMEVFNLSGQKITDLSSEVCGQREIVWDCTQNPSGIYLLSLSTGNYTCVKKVIVIK